MKQRLASLLATAGLVSGMAFVSVGVPVVSAEPTASDPDSLGTDFWLAFPGNADNGDPPALTLLITGSTEATGTVDAPGVEDEGDPGVPFSRTFTVTPGTVTSVIVPSTLDIQTSEEVGNLGIHVTATHEVAVYGLNHVPLSTDGYLGLPVDALGTEYIAEGYKNLGSFNGSEFAVVAAHDATTVTINPTVTTIANVAGTPYSFILNQGETYQLRAGGSGEDVSGSIVTADKPVAVFGGHQCAAIGGIPCNHLVEQMPPTGAWGKSFVTQPFAMRTGDVFRYLASTDATQVWVNGLLVATLNRGTFLEQTLSAASVVTSDKPILVTQYMQDGVFHVPGTPGDGIPGDPFEVVVPPSDQFLTDFTFVTPESGFSSNFINVVAPTASLDSVTLDGVDGWAGSFTAIPGSTFSGAQLAIAPGLHTLSGLQPLGAIVYGLANGDAYGYPAGRSLGSVTPVLTTLTLAPKTDSNPVNTEACVSATVKDQDGLPMAGVGVDFSVTGASFLSGSADTTADGTAQFCYTGTTPGDDYIVATVGTISDDAHKHWTPVDDGQTITALGDAHGWIGLKNGDDQGAKFDLRVELLKNGDTVAWGIQRCITGVGRNPLTAKEVTLPWNAFSPVTVDSDDVLALRFSARIGTSWGGVACNGHSSAIGVRFYYDAALRSSRFAVTMGANASVDLYLHSNGAVCNNAESAGVTSLNTTAPWGLLPGKCKDSATVKASGGNQWMTIGTWTLTSLP